MANESSRSESGDAMRYHRQVVQTAAAAVTVPTVVGVMTYIGIASSGTQVFTLPPALGNVGEYTFIAGDVGGELRPTPATGDYIKGTVLGSVGTDIDTVAIAPAVSVGIKNTTATNVVGDSVTLVSDGVSTWYTKGLGTGIWAAIA